MPNTSLTLANVLPYLERRTEELANWQITDPAHPDYGALVSTEFGMPSGNWRVASSPAPPISSSACWLWLMSNGSPRHGRYFRSRSWLPTAMMRAQRSSGLLDLLSVNYDSSPDTGFTVQQLCTVIELGRMQAQDDAVWVALLGKIEQFIRRAVPGMMDGGFHTPNHRWVIAAALSQAARLFPDLDVRRTVDAYLAEGVDLDAKGFFIERSVGVYDAVNDRSLLLIAENYGWPAALDTVERNLALDLRLLHADGTAETGLSRRQAMARARSRWDWRRAI